MIVCPWVDIEDRDPEDQAVLDMDPALADLQDRDGLADSDQDQEDSDAGQGCLDLLHQ